MATVTRGEPAVSGGPRSEPPLVEISGVSKAFRDVEALRDVDLRVHAGEIHGLVGPSGCGKTTLVRMVVGLTAPDSGEVRVLDRAPERFRPRDREQIGYAPQEFFLDPALTLWENLLFVGRLYGLGFRHRRRRARDLLAMLELADARNRLTSRVSGGMKRRLLLAAALLHEPRLLVVDEPTAGLDPILRGQIWERLRELCDGGTSIIVTTQYLDEADSCDRVAVMSNGAVIADDTPSALRERARLAEAITIVGEDLGREEVSAIWRLPQVRSVRRVSSRELLVFVEDSAAATAAITERLFEQHSSVHRIDTHVPGFDEVFVELVRASQE